MGEKIHGYILEIGKDKRGKPYGLISVDGDKHSYRFGVCDTINSPLRQLQEGDAVEFETYETAYGKRAQLVRKLDQVSEEKSQTNPGFNPSVRLDHFFDDEKRIVRQLGKFFYVTLGGEEFKINKSTYKYCLIKPTDFYQQMFRLTREMVVVFSDYPVFEPRSLDAASHVYNRILGQLRLERGCFLLICRDKKVRERLTTLLRDTNLNQIVIPFTYEELLSADIDSQFIENRFKEYLFDADLFAVSAPIKEDIFFFGRRDFAYDIVAKCKNGTNSGVFGLRRSGKTSLLYAVKRLLERQSYPAVYITCESDLKELPWNKALYKVVNDLYDALEIDKTGVDESKYESTENATLCFGKDMDNALQQVKFPVTIIFDEIEAITFGINQGDDSSNDWFNGDGFCSFWNTVKGYYSKHQNKISILIAGTNPMINEVPYIGEKMLTNPMFKQLSESNQGAYLQPFAIEDTKNMVNALGGYMGLSFDDYTVGRLTDDCGGHPYLIRILCSFINKHVKYGRPFKITKSIYDKVLPEFEKDSEATSFYIMILNILITSYPLEYETLKHLALQGDDIISKIQDKNALSHLLGYGLVENNHDNYSIRFGTIARYLRGEYKFERQGMSVGEQRDEINFRTNQAEIELRKLVRTILRSSMGPAGAKEAVLNAMRSNNSISIRDIQKAEKLDYPKLFDTSINNFPLTCLCGVILDNFLCFENVFEGISEATIREKFSIINLSRRCPAHAFDAGAEKWSWDDFVAFREAISWLESILKDYE